MSTHNICFSGRSEKNIPKDINKYSSKTSPAVSKRGQFELALHFYSKLDALKFVK